jgi:DNA-binding Lrp family transcriptional regulator
MKDRILKLLLEGEALDSAQMAEILGVSLATIEAGLSALREERVLLGWRPVLHPSAAGEHVVRAIIEVKVTPERDGGFDRIAERISRFEEVETCYLMSGSYDLLIIVRGKNLHDVASFVSTRLATIGGVLSTATHFMLRPYKEQGYVLEREHRDSDKPSVSP